MIVIVDYGMGNLRSVQKGFERVGAAAEISRDPDKLTKADKIVLPGVGAFRDAMLELRRCELVEPLLEAIRSVIPGEVVRFDLPRHYKVPHMGWNQAMIRRRAPILEGLHEGDYFYFVHSYYVVPHDPAVVALETDYGGPFCSMIWHDNLFATQFHPEKSQASGLRVLENFARL
jgi:glutamine amidotransferase